MQLRRPRWLTFERAIPFIWIAIFICGITSAAALWEAQPNITNTWLLMGGYAVVEITILAYTPILTRLRNVRAGAIAGAGGIGSYGSSPTRLATDRREVSEARCGRAGR